jgi:Type IIA topoisomerase (DNA gyrase/topo II, topoisomerase IV), B subunit
LRGKILNVEKASLHRVLDTEEILNLVNAIGTGIGTEFKIEKLRYDKIIIMTDADVDGSHIQTLLLTFFFRYMRPLIDEGHIFLAMPPLYKMKVGQKERYLFDEKEKDKAMAEVEDRKNVTINRFKGLGEMSPEQTERNDHGPKRVSSSNAMSKTACLPTKFLACSWAKTWNRAASSSKQTHTKF